MSFDPFGQQPPAQPPFGGPPPGGVPPAYVPGGDVAAARERVQIPGMFLIAVGVLNLLVCLYTGFETVRGALVPAEKMHADALENAERIAELVPAMRDRLLESIAETTPEAMKTQALLQFGGTTVVLLLGALLIILGGVRMMMLRSFGLAVLAAIVAATPCISPCGCCCMGNLIGLWALVVLLSPDVRMAFQ